MSWLLENWFGSQDDLEEVREQIHENFQAETYLGVSGIENPEQSSNRIPSKDLFLALHGEWEQRMEEAEIELLQLVHDEMPPIVRDEVGIIPFFTNVLHEGYLVLTFIRNGCDRDVSFNKLPLSLVTPDGTVVARKTFDMLSFGSIGDQSSRPIDFFFRWEEFSHIPEEEVPLRLIVNKEAKQTIENKVSLHNGLTASEKERYEKVAQQKPTVDGEVELRVLGINTVAEGGLRVAVLFHNGLDKNLEFTEVPILLLDNKGEEVSRMNYGLKNLQVAPNSSRLWGFYIPEEAIKKPQINLSDLRVVIPKAKPEIPRDFGGSGSGLIQ